MLTTVSTTPNSTVTTCMTPSPTSGAPTGGTQDDNEKTLNPANNLLTAHQVTQFIGKLPNQHDPTRSHRDASLPGAANTHTFDAMDVMASLPDTDMLEQKAMEFSHLAISPTAGQPNQVPWKPHNMSAPNTVTGVVGVSAVGEARINSDEESDLCADKPAVGDARDSSDNDAYLNANKPTVDNDARDSSDNDAYLNADRATPPNVAAMDSRARSQSAPDTARSPDDSSSTSAWPPPAPRLMQSIRRALTWNPRPQTVPVFDFRMSEAAAWANYEVLKRHEFDLDKIIRADLWSPLRPGSEFWFYTLLDPIFTGHPLYSNVRRTMLLGARFPSHPIPDDVRLRDLLADHTRIRKPPVSYQGRSHRLPHARQRGSPWLATAPPHRVPS